jgi:EAL domain-containing protein (putative c-di-GMP-specific phosphodiesterase class I)/PAS domain-containing protein
VTNTIKVLIVEHVDSSRFMARQLVADYDLDFQWRYAQSARELQSIAVEFGPGIVYCADHMAPEARRAAVDTLRLLSPRMASVLIVEVGGELMAKPPVDELAPDGESFALSDSWARAAATWHAALPSILEAGRDAVALGDSAGWITYANVQACRLLEESTGKLLGTALGTPHDPEHRAAHRLAFFDDYSALPTPVHASELATRVLACARGEYSAMPLVTLNLRGLRLMNESRGRELGDKVLDIVVSQLRSGDADCGLIAPLSPDDVLMILPPPSHPADAVASVRAGVGTLFPKVSNAMVSNEAPATGNIEIGGKDIPWIIDVAADDDYLDMSASAVNDTNVFLSAVTASRETPPSAVEAGLDEALRRHSMGVHYQPQFDLRSGLACGMEALCRWFLTSGDAIAPAVFISVAERTGRVGALGAYVLKSACYTAAGWKGRDAQRLTLSVNVSTLQINDEFTQVMVETLKNSGFPAQRLELEIAEGALLAGDQAIDRCLQSWKQLGVRIAVNHAGDNYSNLRYLSKLPVDRLKLDKSLIHGMTSNAKSAAMVNALISLGANMGIKVIAEGVETEAQFEMLVRLGCPQAQGYLLGRPMPLAQTLVVLRKTWGNLPRSVRRPVPDVAVQVAS